MSNAYLWLIPGLPLAASIFVALFGRILKHASHWPVLLAAAGSCAVALFAVFQLATHLPHELKPEDREALYESARHGNQPSATDPIFPETARAELRTAPVNWFSAGRVNVSARLVVDPISAVMLGAVTFVGFWIAVYSVGYMHGDPAYPRFFAIFAGFLFAMCGLVLSDNLLLIYAFWEGVGLCSYLLIGFWFEKPAVAAAARKAFLVTRLGDAAFILGIFLLWQEYSSLDLNVIFSAARVNGEVTLASLLIFCGAVGKSAQFPLHVWLPDAMEGPTPVSALIHAATMVTAGVYLIARCMPLFVLAPEVLVLVSGIGALTAMLAALIALTQNDLKRVMAYSTVSQLGFMFGALGAGQTHLASFAILAALFHLFTHAFFKALLFLASGSVMHAMGNVIDMRQFSGLRKVLPITHATFAVGALTLAGFPLLSGFWSKDEILGVVSEASHGNSYASIYFGIWIMLVVTAFLTAFYTARAYFMTFWGEVRIPPDAGDHAHESPAIITIPLVVLATGSVCAGIILMYGHRLAHFLDQTPSSILYLEHRVHHPNYLLMATSAGLAVLGIALAWWMYVRRPKIPAQIATTAPDLYRLSLNRFYFDEIFYALFVAPTNALTMISKGIDLVIDGLVDVVGRLPSLIGGLVRPIQNGLVQFYALAMIAGLTVFLSLVVFRR